MQQVLRKGATHKLERGHVENYGEHRNILGYGDTAGAEVPQMRK